MVKKIDLVFSDIDFGCYEYGFIPREEVEDTDDEDAYYERHVNRVLKYWNLNQRARVVEGTLYVETP